MGKDHPPLSDEQVSGYFRANVGILIINKDRRVLVAERKKIRDAWQLPQGGINQDEEEADAALREIREELGFDQCDTQNLLEFIHTHPCWFAYQLPPKWSGKRGRGQVQKFFAYSFLGEDCDLDERIKKSEEFCAWKWIRMSELIKEAWEVRQPVYEEVLEAFSPWLA